LTGTEAVVNLHEEGRSSPRGRPLEAWVKTVIDSLPDEFRTILTNLLAERDPDLLFALQTQEKPTTDQQESVIDVLADAFTEHLGPDDEPTAQGVLIDNALGAFLTRWPTEELLDE
jgi:hypothetical protein